MSEQHRAAKGIGAGIDGIGQDMACTRGAGLRGDLTPPGTSTLTVTPVPARSFAMIAENSFNAAFDGP